MLLVFLILNTNQVYFHKKLVYALFLFLFQGLGTSDNLWKKIKKDFGSLFWRCRGTNRINPWYGFVGNLESEGVLTM